MLGDWSAGCSGMVLHYWTSNLWVKTFRPVGSEQKRVLACLCLRNFVEVSSNLTTEFFASVVQWSLKISDNFCHSVVYGHWVTKIIWKNQGTISNNGRAEEAERNKPTKRKRWSHKAHNMTRLTKTCHKGEKRWGTEKDKLPKLRFPNYRNLIQFSPNQQYWIQWQLRAD